VFEIRKESAMKVSRLIIVVAAVLGLVESAQPAEFSIYEIQYTTDSNGVSPLDGTIIDCKGGVVVHKQEGNRPRLVLQDPNNPKGWGGIQVKGWSYDAFDNVNIGDWVRLTNIFVEDYRGTTFLQFRDEAELAVVSRNNPIPRPLLVRVSGIVAPIEGVDEWIVLDHSAEKYESMMIKIINVTVTGINYGKANDNYVLQSNVDPNQSCWATDYINSDNEQIYHPYVQIGQDFCSVTGILEQYAGCSEGICYDYYQLLTRYTEDFVVDQVADLDFDCDVDFVDFVVLAENWRSNQSAQGGPNWYFGADLTTESSEAVMDISDLVIFAGHWLEGK
jgi:hypothetical protein